MDYIKSIIKSIFLILISYIAYIIFNNSFTIFSKFKVIYIVLIIILIIYINLEILLKLLYKTKEDSNNELFNIYYVNFPKVYEIAMLIDNKLKTLIEKNTKNENERNISNKIDFTHQNTILKPTFGVGVDSRTLKSIEYKEVKEVKNTNSTILRIVKQKAKKVKSIEKINPGELILVDDVRISIINKEEILQVNSMVSGALKDNVINTDEDGQNLKIDINALSSIILKDYKYQLYCKMENEEGFYISIPMKLEKEFENDYSILDLEIGKVNILGIYRDENYKPLKKSSWNILQEENEKIEKSNQMKDSNTNRQRKEKDLSIDAHPYIDLIAIVQEINLNEVKND